MPSFLFVRWRACPHFRPDCPPLVNKSHHRMRIFHLTGLHNTYKMNKDYYWGNRGISPIIFYMRELSGRG